MKITDQRFKNTLQGDYPIRNGKLDCINTGTKVMVEEEMGSGINTVKSFLKRHARFYEFLRAFLSPGISVIPHLTPRKAITKAFSQAEISNKVMINIGAGTKPINNQLINIDVFPYENTHIVAEGGALPFKDGTIDLVICESVIEHVTEPEKVFAEIRRVLAPGGYAYISVPFMYPFHASPNDFTRFTRNALRHRFSSFEIKEEGMRAGPMTTLQALLMHLFALIFSFGIYPLYLIEASIFMVIFAPLKLLDIPFALLPYSHEIAADIYIFVKKPS
jgi:SAM-dependent methyltransferase